MGDREREEEGEGSVWFELSAGSRHGGVCPLGAQESNVGSCRSRPGRSTERKEGGREHRCSPGLVSSALICHQSKSQPVVQLPSLKSGDSNVVLLGCWY